MLNAAIPTFDVDFNNVDDDDHLVVARPFALRGWPQRQLRRGMTVQLWDSESGSCLARVEQARGRFVDLHILWDSWAPAPTAELSSSWAPTTVPQIGRSVAARIPMNARPALGAGS